MENEQCKNRRNRGILAPVILIVIGMIFLLERNGIIDRQLIAEWWPVAPIFIGGWLLVTRIGRNNNR